MEENWVKFCSAIRLSHFYCWTWFFWSILSLFRPLETKRAWLWRWTSAMAPSSTWRLTQRSPRRRSAHSSPTTSACRTASASLSSYPYLERSVRKQRFYWVFDRCKCRDCKHHKNAKFFMNCLANSLSNWQLLQLLQHSTNNMIM